MALLKACGIFYMDTKTIFEASVPGRRAVVPPALDVPLAELPDAVRRNTPLDLPELSELDVVRHFTRLSQRNFGVDSHFYPLGSCTMKYNPKIAEAVAANQAFAGLHPHLSSVDVYLENCQGALEIIYHMESLLAEIGGMAAGCLQPMAGAHGELTGMLLIAAYHRDAGDHHRNIVLIPDSAHGTNPASAAMAGYHVKEIPSNANGTIDLEAFNRLLDNNVAAVMLTCPNTHGLFEHDVLTLAAAAHEAGALLYYDGANLNAIIGKCRPGDLGFDVMHFNLHKTFGTPHGMGGPGSGAIAVKELLVPFLPSPRVHRQNDSFCLHTPPKSIGKVSPFFGSFLVALRAYVYLRTLGKEGLKQISSYAVLNANYVLHQLKEALDVPFPGYCMHECLLSALPLTERYGVRALDIAKALLDRGFHAPTVYFPLTVKECLMIEPTETESKETLDVFCKAVLEIVQIAQADPNALHRTPISLPVGRLDEVKAAKELDCAELSSAHDQKYA